MPEHTIDEARTQARRAGVYFAEVLAKLGKGYIAVGRDDGSLFIAAAGKNAEVIRELLTGADLAIEQATPD